MEEEHALRKPNELDDGLDQDSEPPESSCNHAHGEIWNPLSGNSAPLTGTVSRDTRSLLLTT